MRADEDIHGASGPQYQAAPVDGTAWRPEARPFQPRNENRGTPPDAGASRLSRMLRAQAQHHQGRR